MTAAGGDEGDVTQGGEAAAAKGSAAAEAFGLLAAAAEADGGGEAVPDVFVFRFGVLTGFLEFFAGFFAGTVGFEAVEGF